MSQWNEEQMRLLGEVLPHVAQQLRIPLNNLSLAASRLTERNDSEKVQRDSAVLQQSYYRMLRLVNNLSCAPMLLDETAFLKQNVEMVAWLNGLCCQAEGLFAEKGVTLLWQCAMPYHIVALHKEYMERLVWNLLSNALKFTPKDGTVTVSLKTAADQVLLCVTDTGCGISDERMDSVFERWLHGEWQDALPYGLGLGLPLCRRIAEGHGGCLLLSSREGEGTAVTVSLPDETVSSDQIRDIAPDYAGGFQHVMLELSDGLPFTAFTSENLE